MNSYDQRYSFSPKFWNGLGIKNDYGKKNRNQNR